MVVFYHAQTTAIVVLSRCLIYSPFRMLLACSKFLTCLSVSRHTSISTPSFRVQLISSPPFRLNSVKQSHHAYVKKHTQTKTNRQIHYCRTILNAIDHAFLGSCSDRVVVGEHLLQLYGVFPGNTMNQTVGQMC